MGSKSSVNNINDSHDDNSVIQAEQSAIRGDGNSSSITYNTTDQGSIKGALSLAASALDTNRDVINESQSRFNDYVKSVNNSSASVLQEVTAANKDSLNTVTAAYRSSTGGLDAQTVIGWVLGAVVALGGLVFVFGGKKNAK
jgi:hypothetical protein